MFSLRRSLILLVAGAAAAALAPGALLAQDTTAVMAPYSAEHQLDRGQQAVAIGVSKIG